MFQNVITILLFTVVAVSNVNCKAHFTWYSGSTIDTASVAIQMFEDQTDLSTIVEKYFPSTSSSYYCSDGIWYATYTKHQGSFFLRNCGSIEPDGTFSSLRLLGEYDKSRLTTFTGLEYSENSTAYTNDQPNISGNWFKSMTLVGNVDVELFIRENYFGLSYCLTRSEHSYLTYIPDITKAPVNLDVGLVKSIRFGCSPSAKVIQLPSNYSMYF